METTGVTELMEQAAKYIALRNELMDRGQRLAEEIQSLDLSSRTIVVQSGDGWFEVSRAYAPSANELPINVRPATVLSVIH